MARIWSWVLDPSQKLPNFGPVEAGCRAAARSARRKADSAGSLVWSSREAFALGALVLWTTSCALNPGDGIIRRGGAGSASQRSLFWGGKVAYLEHPRALVTGFPFSISAWVLTSPGAAQTVAGVYRNAVNNVFYRLRVQSSGLPALEASNVTLRQAVGTRSVADGQWHHLVAVFGGANSRQLYVDGQLAAQDGSAAAFTLTVNRFAIGRDSTLATGAHFGGAIDEVSLHAVALSATEVRTLFNPDSAGSGRPLDLREQLQLGGPSFFAWWPLGELGSDSPGLGSVGESNGLYGLGAFGFSGAEWRLGAPAAPI